MLLFQGDGRHEPYLIGGGVILYSVWLFLHGRVLAEQQPSPENHQHTHPNTNTEQPGRPRL